MTTRNKIFTSVIATFAVMYGGDVCAAPMVSPDSSSSAKPIMQLTSRDYVDGLVAPVKKMVEDHDTLLGHVIMTTTVDTVTGAINELNRTKLNIEGHEASRIVVTNELGAITTATAVEMTQVNGLTTELNSKQIKLTSENLKGSGSVDIAFDENGVITVNGGEGISYTSGDTYVSVDNTTEKISVNADGNWSASISSSIFCVLPAVNAFISSTGPNSALSSFAGILPPKYLICIETVLDTRLPRSFARSAFIRLMSASCVNCPSEPKGTSLKRKYLIASAPYISTS